jgi:hypothetical protein
MREGPVRRLSAPAAGFGSQRHETSRCGDTAVDRGEVVPDRTACAAPTAPPAFAPARRPSGRRGDFGSGLFDGAMSIWPEAGRVLQLAEVRDRSHESLLHLRVRNGSPRGAAPSGGAARGSTEAARQGSRSVSGALIRTAVWRGGNTSSGRGSESAVGVNRASPRGCLRVHASMEPPTTLDHRCRLFGAEHWVATDSSEQGAMCRRPSTFG